MVAGDRHLQLLGPPGRGQLAQLAADRLDLRRPVQAWHPAQRGRADAGGALGARLAQQRAGQQHDQYGLQPVEPVPQPPVHRAGAGRCRPALAAPAAARPAGISRLGRTPARRPRPAARTGPAPAHRRWPPDPAAPAARPARPDPDGWGIWPLQRLDRRSLRLGPGVQPGPLDRQEGAGAHTEPGPVPCGRPQRWRSVAPASRVPPGRWRRVSGCMSRRGVRVRGTEGTGECLADMRVPFRRGGYWPVVPATG